MLMLCYVMLRCLLNFCWQLLRSHCFYSTTLSRACLCYVMLCYGVVGIVVANSSIRIASTEERYPLNAYVMLCYVTVSSEFLLATIAFSLLLQHHALPCLLMLCYVMLRRRRNCCCQLFHTHCI